MTVVIADRGPQLLGVVGLFLALSTFAIILRTYCRVFLVKNFGIDDWLALVAWLLFMFFCTFAITGVYHGTGQHAGSFPLEEIPIGLKWWWACEPVYVLCNMALKLSIGLFLLRIAVAKIHKIIIWTVIVVIEVYSSFYFFLFVLQCRPSSYFWEQYTGTGAQGTCIDPKITVDATYAYSAISCLGDWILAIIPVFIVWNVQMNSRTKLVVALILAMGAVASTATIIRIPYVKDLENLQDFLYATTDVAIWSCSETGIGITASALATLRPLFRTFLSKKHLMGDSTGQGNSKPWPSSGGASGGYIRSRNKTDIEEYTLTENRSMGVTTVIESEADLERGDKERGDKHNMSTRVKVEPAGPLSPTGGWNGQEKKMSDASSYEDRTSWRQHGIMKTTVSTQQIAN